MQNIKIIVSGVVQGVGFRYFCYKNAIALNIKGYAKNLNNGNVEIDAEGEEISIKEFLKTITIGNPHFTVKSINTELLIYEGKYKEFCIL